MGISLLMKSIERQPDRRLPQVSALGMCCLIAIAEIIYVLQR